MIVTGGKKRHCQCCHATLPVLPRGTASAATRHCQCYHTALPALPALPHARHCQRCHTALPVLPHGTASAATRHCQRCHTALPVLPHGTASAAPWQKIKIKIGEMRVDHRHLSNIVCLMARTACFVCFISTVNGHRKKMPYKTSTSSRHITKLKQSILKTFDIYGVDSWVGAGKTNWRVWLSTVHLLIMVACFVK